MKILAIPGSLRTGSYNRALLEACAELLPEGHVLEIHDLGKVPLYNQDLDGDDPPASVSALRDAIGAADAVLLATPEYNYGIPGVLKNAIDWASRPAFRSNFVGKPVGMMSASPAATGGARAQLPLQNVLLGMLAEPFPHPGVAVAQAMKKIEDGKLTDGDTRKFVADYLEKFVAWAGKRAA